MSLTNRSEAVHGVVDRILVCPASFDGTGLTPAVSLSACIVSVCFACISGIFSVFYCVRTGIAAPCFHPYNTHKPLCCRLSYSNPVHTFSPVRIVPPGGGTAPKSKQELTVSESSGEAHSFFILPHVVLSTKRNKQELTLPISIMSYAFKLVGT